MFNSEKLIQFWKLQILIIITTKQSLMQAVCGH